MSEALQEKSMVVALMYLASFLIGKAIERAQNGLPARPYAQWGAYTALASIWIGGFR